MGLGRVQLLLGLSEALVQLPAFQADVGLAVALQLPQLPLQPDALLYRKRVV